MNDDSPVVTRITLLLMALTFLVIGIAPFVVVLQQRWRSGLAALAGFAAFLFFALGVVIYLGTAMGSINTGYGPDQPWLLIGGCLVAVAACGVAAIRLAASAEADGGLWTAIGVAALFWAVFWATPIYTAWESVINFP